MYPSSVFRIMRSRKWWWLGYVIRIGNTRNELKIFMGKSIKKETTEDETEVGNYFKGSEQNILWLYEFHWTSSGRVTLLGFWFYCVEPSDSTLQKQTVYWYASPFSDKFPEGTLCFNQFTEVSAAKLLLHFYGPIFIALFLSGLIVWTF